MLQKEKKEFHINCISIMHEQPKEEKQTSLSNRDIQILKSSGFSVDGEKPLLPNPQIQHSGLRCKKCFELLVRDDEFLY